MYYKHNEKSHEKYRLKHFCLYCRANIKFFPYNQRAIVKSSTPWVKFLVNIFEPVLVNVGVDLGCGDVRVAEHHLDSP